MFLILVDAYSKWMEVVPVKSATSQITMEKLRTIFVTHGLPEMLVSDNGSVFSSAEFKEFTSRNAIRPCISFALSPVIKWLSRESSAVFQVSNEEDARRLYRDSHSQIPVSSTIDTPYVNW